MTELSADQIARVAGQLRSAKLTDSLYEDLLDHLCCEIEEQIMEGAKFESAFHITFNRWSAERLRKLNRNINFTTKTKPMFIKIVSLATVLAACFLLSPSIYSPEPTVNQHQVFGKPESDNPELELALLDPAYKPPAASPLAGVELSDVYSGFGMRIHPIMKKKMLHTGMDFRADIGTPVLSTADGTVTFAGKNGKHGIQVVIAHSDGYSTAYSHLQSHLVEADQRVELGEMIGAVGTSGMSTGPHLHYEVRKDDRAINPLALNE